MNDPTFDRSFGFLLHDIARLLGKRFEQRARSLGLSLAQWRVLAHLQRCEGTNQSRLAELMEIEPISLARLIDRMEEAGLVQRRSDPADRRVHRLYLSAGARPKLEQGRALGDAVRNEAFAGLVDQEWERLIELLLCVRGNLSERRGDDDKQRASLEPREAMETTT